MLPPVDAMMRDKAINAPGDTLSLTVETHDSGEVVGVVRLTWSEAETGLGELGFAFDPAHAHRAYCVEALQAVMDFAFTQLPFENLAATCDLSNDAREKPLRRLGLQPRVGSVTATGKRIYEISRTDWARIHAESSLVA